MQCPNSCSVHNLSSQKMIRYGIKHSSHCYTLVWLVLLSYVPIPSEECSNLTTTSIALKQLLLLVHFDSTLNLPKHQEGWKHNRTFNNYAYSVAYSVGNQLGYTSSWRLTVVVKTAPQPFILQYVMFETCLGNQQNFLFVIS